MRISINPYQTATLLTHIAPFHSNENLLKVWSRYDCWNPSTFYIKMSQILIFYISLASALDKLLPVILQLSNVTLIFNKLLNIVSFFHYFIFLLDFILRLI